MKHLNRTVTFAVVSLLAFTTLVECQTTQKSTSQTSPNVASNSNANKEGFATLVGVVSNTKTAVEAGNFDRAKQEFDKFEKTWLAVEDGIKTKSPNIYGAIEDASIQVKSALDGQDKTKTFEALQTLDKNIAAASQA